jgi:hypothetical protein
VYDSGPSASRREVGLVDVIATAKAGGTRLIEERVAAFGR